MVHSRRDRTKVWDESGCHPLPCLSQQHPVQERTRSDILLKLHFDLSKQTAEDNASEYYTVQEVMKKYNLTRDSVYGILQFHEIKREKKGRFVRFLKVEFDHVMGVRK